MNISSTSQLNQQHSQLRRAMRSNGVFSGLSGLVFLVASKPLASFTGLTSPAVFMELGALLIIYDLFLFGVTARTPIDRKLAYAAVFLDFLWVLGSVVILLAGWPPLAVAGKWMVVILAEVVAAFAIWQAYSIRKTFGES